MESDASGNIARSFGHLLFGDQWYEQGATGYLAGVRALSHFPTICVMNAKHRSADPMQVRETNLEDEARHQRTLGPQPNVPVRNKLN
jgi:hypothetical protein